MKMNSSGKVFLIIGMTFVILLLCYFLPTIKIGNEELRQIDLFSDIDPNSAQNVAINKPDVIKKKQGHWKETWAKGVEPIVNYGDTIENGNGMDHFYQAVLNAKKMNRPVRIVYFGDSFIESDIMVGELRRLLQQKFGGCGVGWADFVPGFNSARLTIQQKYTGMDSHIAVRRKEYSSELGGISQSYYVPHAGATADIHQGYIDRYHHTFKNVYAFVRTASPLTITSSAGTVSLQGSKNVQMAKFSGNNLSSINFSFSGPMSGTYLFGAAMEGDKGIVLDNMGMRGSPGVSLGYTPDNTLADFARLRPYDLIIIHFGLNAAASCKSDAYCKHYMELMKAGIEKFRKAYPQASILLVSASDMEKRNRTTGQLGTLPEVEKLVAYQQNLAAECGIGFYSMFNVMGGNGSIAKLVEQGKAEKDYTHINQKGGEEIAGRFFRSILGGLDNYKRKKAAGY